MATTTTGHETSRPWTELTRSVFSFPNPVNEVAARMVAGMVVLLALAAFAIWAGRRNRTWAR